MPYGPQDEERFAKEDAEHRKNKTGSYTPKRKRSGPSRIISRPTSARAADSTTPDPEVIIEEVEVGGGGGSSGQRYVTPNYQQHVFMALSLSLILVLLSAYARGRNNSAKQVNQYLDPKADPAKFATAWVGIAIILLAGASFRGTDKLAAAFAWLIFVAVLLVNGEQALGAFSASVKPSNVSSGTSLPDIPNNLTSGGPDEGGPIFA